MKVLFVVQGEGRGHLTQALTMEKALRDNGHEVVEILVGRSKTRELPGFFMKRAKAPVSGFWSPNFLPSKANQRIGLTRSIAYNLIKSPMYLSTIHFLYQRIKHSEADLVINFYEILTGITYFLLRPNVPEVCIGHQYLFMHPDYSFPTEHKMSQKLMLAFTKVTSLGAEKKLALSFRQACDVDKKKIAVVPPLLRDDVLSMDCACEDFITGYILNAGFSASVMQWHDAHPDVPLHFFWDKEGADETTRIDETLTFHRIDDKKFLQYLSHCKAYATTGGFESVCEAMYMGKPVMMVPAHVEQECNANEAMNEGAGVVADRFDMDKLRTFSDTHTPDTTFRDWENSAKWMIVSRLEAVVESHQEHLQTAGFAFSRYFHWVTIKDTFKKFTFWN